MERADRRLNNLEQTAQTILKNQREEGRQEDLSIVPRNEIEGLRKMQDQMESDLDMAKRLQREMDEKYQKEKKKEEKKEKKEKRLQEKKDRDIKTPTSSPSSFTSTPSGMQECPICTLRVPFSDLELHVNQCLESIEGNGGSSSSSSSNVGKDSISQEKASFWKRVFGPGPKKKPK